MIYGIKLHDFPSTGSWMWGQDLGDAFSAIGDYCTLDVNKAYQMRGRWSLMSPSIKYVVEEYTGPKGVAGATGPIESTGSIGVTGCTGATGVSWTTIASGSLGPPTRFIT